jgi:hypothetical protein
VGTEYEETFGALIRQFFREIFGSRLTQHLEEEILKLRNDHDRALHDRDVQIASQREEIARLNGKIVIYEHTVMAHSSKMGAEVVAYQRPTPPKPKFDFVDMPPTLSRWQQIQNAHDDKITKEEAEEAEAAKKLAATAVSKE